MQIKGTSHKRGRLVAFVALVALATLGRQPSAKSGDPTYTLFEVPGATGTQANSINNRGDIAGQLKGGLPWAA